MTARNSAFTREYFCSAASDDCRLILSRFDDFLRFYVQI
ncbi:hypothetical protein CAMRE0001_2679 [Campylobacter rectus RM3267]|uniref:Uncharacterized protein n=1 Tax=Campylobacter rectus RM3267 TaxID=553218 RepID=B9D3Y5_CAMRE|nr:hypothetical protein CAMRE0001_2679 [Campylobacter rectus RM3267]